MVWRNMVVFCHLDRCCLQERVYFLRPSLLLLLSLHLLLITLPSHQRVSLNNNGCRTHRDTALYYATNRTLSDTSNNLSI